MRPALAPRPATAAAAEEPARKPRIVVLLPRGEAIRNFVYTGMLDSLRKHAEIVLLSVIPSPSVQRLLEAHADTLLELAPDPPPRLARVLGELVDMAHGRWIWSEAAKQRWHLRDVEADTPAARMKRSVKKALCYPFANRRGTEILASVHSAASRLLSPRDYVHLLRRLRPALVFNGSHVHSQLAAPVVEAARELGIPTAAFIFSWDNLTSQGRIVPIYDDYLVWSEGLRDQLLALYDRTDRAKVFVTGSPQFDFHRRAEYHVDRETFCRQVGADPKRPIVLYTTGMANHMPGEPRIVEGIARMLRGMPELGPAQLMVRVYAKDRTGRFEETRARNPDVLFPPIPWEPTHLTPLPEDSALLTNMLRHAAVGINVASTVTLELCMFDKPALNVAYNPPGIDIGAVDYGRYYGYDHYRPVAESGAVAVARSERELEAFLREALEHPEVRRAARHELVQRFFGATLDGQSAARVADTLLGIASADGPRLR